MIPNQALLGAIRRSDFSHHTQKKRVHVYKQVGGTRRIEIRRKKEHDPETVARLLRSIGWSDEQIQQFVEPYLAED